MREILFRGKRCDNKQWIEGFYVLIGEENPNAYIVKNNGQKIRVAHKSVSQYTGLTDENGKKIFEDDVVEYESHGYIPSVERGRVTFKDGCYNIMHNLKYCGLYYHRIGMVSQWQDMGASGKITYTYKIIGNIHDNPELVEV